jgi:hypothetical protein
MRHFFRVYFLLLRGMESFGIEGKLAVLGGRAVLMTVWMDKDNSRSPSGMTTRKATTKATAKAKAKYRDSSLRSE